MFRGATKLDEAAQKDFAASIEHLNTFLSQNKYVAGDQLTIADICLMANASTFEVNTTLTKPSFILLIWLSSFKFLQWIWHFCRPEMLRSSINTPRSRAGLKLAKASWLISPKPTKVGPRFSVRCFKVPWLNSNEN